MKLLVCFLIAFNTLSCQQDKNIKLEKGDFSISYPSHLELNESGQEGASFILATQKDGENDIFLENINLVTKNVGEETFNELANQTEREINSVARIVENKRLKINGKDCLRLVAETTQNNINLTFIQHYYVENQKMYVLTFLSESKVFNDYFDEMNKTLMSFKIK